MAMLDPVVEEVRHRIDSESLSIAYVSGQIGVGATSLVKHLAGAYVRSDSLAKYRRWLSGASSAGAKDSVRGTTEAFTELPSSSPLDDVSVSLNLTETGKLNVVDLFCGCGGMSLGFERFQGGNVFQTVLALDIEAPMVKVFNDNHLSESPDIGIARRSDISDFMNEAEVLAFYLEHLSRTSANQNLARKLRECAPFGLDHFRNAIAEIDADFLQRLMSLRLDLGYQAAVKEMGTGVLGQTSVIGFHNATKLPVTGMSSPKMGPLIWYGDGFIPQRDISNLVGDQVSLKTVEKFRKRMRKLWDAEVEKLSERASGSGRGQLASAAERMDRFLRFLSCSAMAGVKTLWIDWRAKREALRVSFFENPTIGDALRSIYEQGHRASVVLGGPPCQGFSRIGRGKIRSLREQGVHVHEDEDSVDSRNQLMHQYVLFVAALAPDVFLFENVRHFQAVVRSEGVEFDAADILAEAISEVSTRGLGYSVSRRIVVASEHGVPQNRERFVMAGVRRDVAATVKGYNAAAMCLSLTRKRAVPLGVALEGLSTPSFSGSAGDFGVTSVAAWQGDITTPSEDFYRQWTFTGGMTDAHLARPPRRDDAAFFSLMGPGKRWMDYRCDDSPTLAKLTNVLKKLGATLEQEPKLAQRLGIDPSDVLPLVDASDGSLSLRLLLECIEPLQGEEVHHLLTTTYLNKREGAHGDWMARMDANLPSKTVVSHMAKDTYAFVHPFAPRTISVREAARIQAFPDDYKFGSVGLVDGFRVVGNAVPPLLTVQFAELVAKILSIASNAQVKDCADGSKGGRSVLAA